MENFNTLINSSTPVLVDFYADWCAPCKMMAPVLKQTKDTLGDKIRIIKIDTEANQTLAMQYQIRSIPTMMLFKNGQKLWQTSGAMPATELLKQLKQFVN